MGGCANQPITICSRCGQRMHKSKIQFHKCNVQVPDNSFKNSNPRINPQQKQSFMNVQTPKVISNPFLPFLRPNFPPNPFPLQPQLYMGGARQVPNQFIDIKLPANPERTKFTWSKQPTIFYPPFIKQFKPEIIRMRSFQEKLLWFRLIVQNMRISWQNGSEMLRVDRAHILKSSVQGLKQMNLKKELKIKFDDEVVDDAGGLLREWMHLTVKQIFSNQTGMFQQCVTDQTAYKITWDRANSSQFSKDNFFLLGVIVGKALFDRVPVNCYLNRTILRQIASQTVLMNDVYNFDKDLYNSWKSILDTDGAQQLCLVFAQSKTHSDGSTEVLDLVVNGKNIEVTDKNKYQYIYEIIQLYCCRSVHQQIKALQAGIYKVVPQQLLSVFEPYQLQMMLTGPQVIDVKDWKQNTLYKGYKYTDQNIVWFWSVVQKYDQKKLANLLHYCTGSTRVPILGFKYLQSNRNTINNFTIQKAKFDKNNPYPKSYTCFNRLELPEYTSLKELQRYLDIVINQEITHFGLG